MSEEYILKVTERLYFKNKDGMQSKSFFTLHTHIYLGNIPLSWIDDRDFLDRLKELVRLRDSRDYIDIIPIAELTEEMQVKVRNNYEINSKDHNNAQYRVNAYIDRRLRQTQPSTVDATAEQPAPASSGDTKEYKHITFEIAAQVLDMLSDGKTQVDIAGKLKFSEKQFRVEPKLKNIKKWVKECKDKRRLQLLNLHQYGMLDDQELEDELNDLQHGHRKL